MMIARDGEGGMFFFDEIEDVVEIDSNEGRCDSALL
jgi:hypothetical protein